MANRMIIASDSDSVTNGQRDTITRFLKDKQWGFWHWYADLWLVTRLPDGLTAGDVRAEIDGLFPGRRKPRIMILNAAGGMGSGRAPKAAWPWLEKNWR